MKTRTGILSSNAVQTEINNLLKNNNQDCGLINPMSKDLTKKYLASFDRIILPFPSTKKNLSVFAETEYFSDYFNRNQIVIGGMLYKELKACLEAEKISFVDYFSYEPYIMRNAFLTSQGALRLLLENSERQLAGKNVLITGFGRIGKSLANILRATGMRVSVAVRSEKQAVEAKSMGYDVFRLSSLNSIIFYFDFIFNTVAYRLFGCNDIKHIRDDAVYFELASSPFGADEEDFNAEGKRFVNGSSLPGRFYPKAVAENIYELILNNSELMKGDSK